MGREVKVGVTIGAKDNASKEIDSLKKGLKNAQDATKGVHSAIIVLSQASQLASRAIGLVQQAFASTVGKAIEFRDKLNANRIAFETMIASINEGGGKIGDLFLPAALALGTAFAEVLKGLTDMNKATREATAVEISKWAIDAGKDLAMGLAVGARLGVMAIQGLKMAWHEAKSAAGSFNAEVQSGTAWLLKAGAAAVDNHGKIDPLRDLLLKGAKAYEANAKASETWADSGAADAAKDLAAMEAYKAGITKTLGVVDRALDHSAEVAKKAAKKLGDAFVDPAAEARAAASRALRMAALAAEENGIKAMQAHITESTQTNAERRAEIEGREQDARNVMVDAATAERMYLISKETQAGQQAADLRTEAVRLSEEKQLAIKQRNFERSKELQAQIVQVTHQATEAQMEAFKPLIEMAQQVGSGIGSAFTTAFDQIIEGGHNASEIIGGLFKSIGKTIIDTLIQIGVQAAVGAVVSKIAKLIANRAEVAGNAAVAASSAFAAYVGIPFVGPGLAAAAAATAYSGAMAFQAAIPLAQGGLVRGGQAGRDSVLMAAMPGEFVVPAEQVRKNVSEGRAPDDSGSARGSQGGAPFALHVHAETHTPLRRADVEDMVRKAIVPAMEHMFRIGKFRPAGA